MMETIVDFFLQRDQGKGGEYVFQGSQDAENTDCAKQAGSMLLSTTQTCRSFLYQ